MLYLGIDQHRKQLTVCLRDEAGTVILRRQVSTQWDKVRAFLASLRDQAAADGGYLAVVEICGFNDWLLKELDAHDCQQTIVVQPTDHQSKKTDRRDANRLSEILWLNRHRFIAGQKVNGLRQIVIPSQQDGENRQLTALRKRVGQQRTLNKIHRILLKHNLQQDCPTKGLQTKMARQWLETIPLAEIDRLEIDHLLAQWQLWDQQLHDLELKIRERAQGDKSVQILRTIPRMGADTALAMAASIGDIERFRRSDSLANYWGLTPGCRNSGEATQRLGSITKEGSPTVRFLLGQMVLQILRGDPSAREWFKRIKRRRGAKIAFVAVMRRLATIIWHLLKHQEAYQPGCWLRVPKKNGASVMKTKPVRIEVKTSAQAQTNGASHIPFGKIKISMAWPYKKKQRQEERTAMNQHGRMPIDKSCFACCIGLSPVIGDEVLAAFGQFEVAHGLPLVWGASG